MNRLDLGTATEPVLRVQQIQAFDYYGALRRLRHHVRGHLQEPISLGQAASVVGLERSYFSTYFHRKVGICFRDWLSATRVFRAIELIEDSDRSLAWVSDKAGFSDRRTFQRAFKKWLGLTPRDFRQQVRAGRGAQRIGYRQRAVSRLLLLNRGTELRRPRNERPKKWVVAGPKSPRLPAAASAIDPTVVGLGDTIAAAVADYERKQGSLGAAPGHLLNSRDLTAIEWYSEMSATGASTSVVRTRKGSYRGEYSRPGRGSLSTHRSSMAAVIEWLRGQGA